MADHYWIGAIDGNWTSVGNWSATDGGASNGTTPTSSSAVFLTATSSAATNPSVTVDTASQACASINCTGFTTTLTLTQQLTVSGDITFVAGMTLAGTGKLIINNTSTFTSGGKTLLGALQIGEAGLGSKTFTLGDNWDVDGAFTVIGSSGSVMTINGNTLNIGDGFTISGMTSGTLAGTTTIVLDGTGTWSSSQTSGTINVPLTINTAGTITLSGTLRFAGTTTITYTAGTVTTTGSTFRLQTSGSKTLALNGITFNNLQVVSTGTYTFSNNVICSGLLTVGNGGTGTTTINTSTITTSGGLTLDVTTGMVIGTTTIKITGGTFQSTSVSTGALRCSVELAGNSTISGTIRLGGGGSSRSLTYTSGTITVSGSVLVIGSTTYSIICNGAGFSLNGFNPLVDCTLSGSNGFTIATLTMNTASVALTVSVASVVVTTATITDTCSFIGTEGISFGTFTCTTSGKTVTLKSTETYAVTTLLTLANMSLVASTASSAVLFNLSGSQSVATVVATDMDSSGGSQVIDIGGTLTRTVNWVTSATSGNMFLVF